MYYALIMAGGSGTRLWPLSRNNRSKQTLKLVGDRTMFQHAVGRLSPLFPPDCIFVVTREDQSQVLSAQAPDLPFSNFIVEPIGRGTAPAIGLAAIHLRHRDPEAIMAVLTADHYIQGEECFRRALQTASIFADQGQLVTLGIKPSSPATGYGYIQQGKCLGMIEGFHAYQVKQFIEKPHLEMAKRMVQSGEFSWNSGMFIWRADRILEEIENQLPGLFAQLTEIAASIGTRQYETVIHRIWPQVEKQTIDYGVMEEAKNVTVIPVEIGWTDIGSWSSLEELLPKNQNANIALGPSMQIDTHDTLIFGNKRLIATIGVEGLIIIDTEDALLICPKERDQDVRQVVEQLKANRQDQWL